MSEPKPQDTETAALRGLVARLTAESAELEATAEWEATRLRSALEAYGRHYDWCDGHSLTACTCGLAEHIRGGATEPVLPELDPGTQATS